MCLSISRERGAGNLFCTCFSIKLLTNEDALGASAEIQSGVSLCGGGEPVHGRGGVLLLPAPFTSRGSSSWQQQQMGKVSSAAAADDPDQGEIKS